MPSAGSSRNQIGLRVPVDHIEVTLVMHDGQRVEVVLFVPPGEELGEFLATGAAFLPTTRDGHPFFIARAAIAGVGIQPPHLPQLDEELPMEQQHARVTLRSGATIDGTLQWVGLDGRRRTSDGLNAEGDYLVVVSDAMTFLVKKTHVATVSES